MLRKIGEILCKIIPMMAIAILIAVFIDLDENNVVSYDFVINMLGNFFSIALAIVAILFTILDRYKDKVADKIRYTNKTDLILKEMAENAASLLVIMSITIVCSMLKSLLGKISCFNANTSVIVFTILISVAVMFDISIAMINLINGLREYEQTNDDDLKITESEKLLIESYRKLDTIRTNELLETIKTLIIKQNYDKEIRKK